MKNMMIKRFNVVISLWLIVIIATLVIFGYYLNAYGFYIAAMVFGTVLASINVLTIISGVTSANKNLVKTEEKYSNYR